MDFRSPTTGRMSVLLLFFWGSMIAVEGFLVPYLTGIGFSERQAGFVMAAVFLISVVSTPVWGYVADRTDLHQRIIGLALVVAIAAVMLIRVSGTSFGLIIIFALLYSLTAISMPGLIDSWIMKMRRGGATISYGIARGFGSLGYALTGAILGGVLDRHGLIQLFPVYAGITFIVVVLVATTRVPSRPPVSGDERRETSRFSGSPVRAILSNRRYMVLLVSTFFALLGTRAALTFLPLRIYSLGGTTVHVGWSMTLFSGSEIPFMFLSAFLLRRLKPRTVILAGMVFFVVRLVLTRIAGSTAMLLAVQLVHGASIGLLLPASVHYIDRISPPHLRSLFQTLAPSIYFGLGSVVGSALGGAIISRFGLDTLYTLAPIVSALGVIVFAASMATGRSQAIDSQSSV